MTRLLLPSNVQKITQLASRALSQAAIDMKWSRALEASVERHVRFPINHISIAKYVKFGELPDRHDQLIRSCQFMKTEGLIRLSHMIQEMRTLPESLLNQPELNKVYGWYLESFKQLNDAPMLTSKSTMEDVDKFTPIIRSILRRHETTVMVITTGFRKLRSEDRLKNEYYVVNYLNRFFMSRIGIRFLLNQHLGLVDVSSGSEREWIGSIDKECNVESIIRNAGNNAKALCDSLYYHSPEFEIQIRGAHAPVVSYVPSHLYHIMFELLKNSFRAVAESHSHAHGNLPPVKVIVVKTNNDLTIKVSDEGGGIPFADVPKLFSYFYTTAEAPDDEALLESDMNNAPMAGFGFGLPVSRLYARYFGGDLRLISIDSYGTDAFVFLKSVAQDATEVLPSFSPSEMVYREEKSHWIDVAHH